MSAWLMLSRPMRRLLLRDDTSGHPAIRPLRRPGWFGLWREWVRRERAAIRAALRQEPWG